MPVSGIGVLTSGLIGVTRPTRTPLHYDKTSIYNIPFFYAGLTKVSATDTGAFAQIVENQLTGISRGHSVVDTVIRDGRFQDRSNHPAHNLIVSVTSGLTAYINGIYIGDGGTELSWSGLSHAGANYLWAGLVEDFSAISGTTSSRQFRELTTFSNSSATQVQDAVLVATYTSGVGIDINPSTKQRMLWLADHVADNQNPHGGLWLQDYMLVSGLEVIGSGQDLFLNSGTRWNGLGIQSGVPFRLNQINRGPDTITFDNDLLFNPGANLITSGVDGTIASGTNIATTLLKDLFKSNVVTQIQNLNLGNVVVISEFAVSGSTFRQNIAVAPTRTVDGVDLSRLVPLISGSSISGNPVYHTHSLLSTSGVFTSISPKYPGSVFIPVNSINSGPSYKFEYNFDLGTPTLRVKPTVTTAAAIYIREWMPQGYNTLESLNLTYQIDSGLPSSSPALCQIRDSLGVLYNPRAGYTLTSSGLSTITVSGFAQSGFSQNLPFDVELTVPTTSGINAYFSDLVFNYKIV